MPFALLYFLYRSIKEPGYASNLTERLSFYRKEFKGVCWCHAVSLGEFRAARPIFKKLLLNGEKLLITTLTLSGKSAAQQEYRKEIKEGKVLIVYAPLEITFMVKRFLKNFQPRCCIILECDLWPVMIMTTYKRQIPLIFAQAQYPEKGFIRDKKFPFLKASLIEKFDLIICNPPYFNATYLSESSQRNQARHQTHLSAHDLYECGSDLLAEDGSFNLIIPAEEIEHHLHIAAHNGLFLHKILHTLSPNGKRKRALITLGFEEKGYTEEELLVKDANNQYSEEYIQLTKDFYQKNLREN